MTVQDLIQHHLETSGISMRALGLQSGLEPRAVHDILHLPGIRPDRKTLDALGTTMGKYLPTPQQMTYGKLIRDLSQPTGDEKVDRRNRVLISRLKKFLQAAGWVAETEFVDRRRAISKLSTWSAATLGLSELSFGTYKSDILATISSRATRNRPSGIRDVSGMYREIHAILGDSNFPRDLQLISGSFFCFLEQEGIKPGEITMDVLRDYYLHRLAVSPKGEVKCKKHVRRISALCNRLASDPVFARFGFVAAQHPFDDARNKYGVCSSVFVSIMSEFDGPVTRWLRAEESRDGLSFDDFLKQLDAAENKTAVNPKKALLKKAGGRKRSEDERQSAGFLLPDETWCEVTIVKRRAQLIAGAKALYAARGYKIENLAEFTDPDVVDNVLDALSSGTSSDEFPSTYAESVGKTLKKLARDYIGRSVEDVNAILGHIKEHAIGEVGISKRNKSRLRQIVGDRQQRLIDLSDILIEEINITLDGRKGKSRKKRRVELLGKEQCRDIMCAVASDILLARAPRKANVTDIRLTWISWIDGRARIVVPNVEVKNRGIDDPDLHIPLDGHASERLKMFIGTARPKALFEGDEDNPFLFPSQAKEGGFGRSYGGLMPRLMRHTKRIVGIQMNPHLYRHFLGWLWLKEDPDRLPDVQRLLGHKRLETTLAHYAEIDEDLALDRWSKYLSEKKSRQPKNLKGKR